MAENNIILKGVASSPGIEQGKAALIIPEPIVIPSSKIENERIEEEINRFEFAVKSLVDEFTDILNRMKDDKTNVTAIIETNILYLQDPYIQEGIISRIKDRYSAESAVIQEFDNQRIFFKSAKDALLRERATELDQIKERLLSALKNKCLVYNFPEGTIIVAQSVLPAEVLRFDELKIGGIITEIGGITSHSSILARTFGIPEIIDVKNALSTIKDNDTLIIDGYNGFVIVNPDQNYLERYRTRKAAEDEHKKKLGDLIKLDSETKDGKKITLLANVDFPKDVEAAILVGAEGIGLVRTEHLVISNDKIPDEDEQFRFYNELAERAYPKPVNLRIFDLGSDKYAEGLPKRETNPALGLRGMRFLLHRLDLLETQIKAILRASKNKNVSFMLPMVTTINEVIQVKEIIEKCKRELAEKNIDFDPNIPIGLMIETPAAAIMSDELAKHCSFFSIGTNDLTQYSLAVDRDNELVSQYFDAFNPAVIRLMEMIVESAHKNNISVSICGELAGHSAATKTLIDIGIDKLSVPPSLLLELKSRVRDIDLSEK
ncbi:MAG TPA: phosphoenolpyruvate--protein phosphotransferase [Candidatus Kapabacteria bacterium]|nr:phosphoenolpyruvate--protein phosphotransferase [Candidatus Kapabacteria bacterium]